MNKIIFRVFKPFALMFLATACGVTTQRNLSTSQGGGNSPGVIGISWSPINPVVPPTNPWSPINPVIPPTNPTISNFKLLSSNGLPIGTVQTDKLNINVLVPQATSLTNFKTSFDIPAKATVNIKGTTYDPRTTSYTYANPLIFVLKLQSGEQIEYTITVNIAREFAYVLNNTGSISVLSITDDGILHPYRAFATNQNISTSLVFAKQSKFAYVVDYNDSYISMFRVLNTGLLEPLTQKTVVTGAQPTSITIDPSGNYAYTTNYNSNTVSMYHILSDGTLDAIGVVETGSSPVNMAFDHSGQYAFVINYNGNSISMYKFSNGKLIANGTMPTGSVSQSIKFDPSGKYVYVPDNNTNNNEQNTIEIFSLTNNGQLYALPKVPVGQTPGGIVFDPLGKYAYALNSNTCYSGDCKGSITMYNVHNANLTPIPNQSDIPLGYEPASIVANSQRNFVYVAGSSLNNISMYIISNYGILQPLAQATIPSFNAKTIVLNSMQTF